MKRAIVLVLVSVVAGVVIALVWAMSWSASHVWWITIFHRDFSVEWYNGTIYLDWLPSLNVELFAVEHLRLSHSDPHWLLLKQLHYFAGFGFGRVFQTDLIVALPLWAVAVLMGMAAVVVRVVFRRLGRGRARKRGFEVVRGEDLSM
jgi:hypothetical protein